MKTIKTCEKMDFAEKCNVAALLFALAATSALLVATPILLSKAHEYELKTHHQNPRIESCVKKCEKLDINSQM